MKYIKLITNNYGNSSFPKYVTELQCSRGNKGTCMADLWNITVSNVQYCNDSCIKMFDPVDILKTQVREMNS